MKRQEWNGFTGGLWQDEIDVRNFIQKNYTPYGGDSSFLCGPTQRTLDVRKKFEDLLLQEHANGGALKVDTETVITPTSFGPGYLDKEKDIIVGLQTDEPFKAGLQSLWRHAHGALRLQGLWLRGLPPDRGGV